MVKLEVRGEEEEGGEVEGGRVERGRREIRGGELLVRRAARAGDVARRADLGRGEGVERPDDANA